MSETFLPVIHKRDEQPYVALRATTVKEKIPEIVPGMFARLGFLLVVEHEKFTDAPFIRYLVKNAETGEMEIEVGFPLSSVIQTEAPFIQDVLPAGNYATTIHHGSHDTISDTTVKLFEWAEQSHLNWKGTLLPEGHAWAAKVEHYLVGPQNESDPEKWKTEIAILLAE